MKLKCLLLDDELPGLAYLKLLCQQIPELEVVRAFDSPERFLAECKDLIFDFCILDIEMPGLNGLEIAQLLKNKPVIFCTAYSEFAADAFDLSAVDYIRKPIQRERLEKAIARIEKIVKVNSLSKDFFNVNTSKGKAIIFFDQILHITTAEKEKRDKLLRLETNEILTLKNISFDELLQILPQERFCRVSKKDIVAIKAVKFFAHDEITTSILSTSGENMVILLSEHFKEEFLRRLKT